MVYSIFKISANTSSGDSEVSNFQRLVQKVRLISFSPGGSLINGRCFKNGSYRNFNGIPRDREIFFPITQIGS